MSDIYRLHDAAFAQVAAYVVLLNGEKVASVALKFPRDGAGRLFAYVHWTGTEMVRAYAGGGGYDKRSAAIASAVRKLAPLSEENYADGVPHHSAAERANWTLFRDTLAQDSGRDWNDRLRDAGFIVHQAV